MRLVIRNRRIYKVEKYCDISFKMNSSASIVLCTHSIQSFELFLKKFTCIP